MCVPPAKAEPAAFLASSSVYVTAGAVNSNRLLSEFQAKTLPSAIPSMLCTSESEAIELVALIKSAVSESCVDEKVWFSKTLFAVYTNT